MFEIYAEIKEFIIKKSDFLTNILNLCIRTMEDLDLIGVVFGEFGGFLDHVLINIGSDDFDLVNWSFLLLVVEEKFRMPTMSKSPIKAKGSVSGELIIDFLCKHGNMAEHFYLREIN